MNSDVLSTSAWTVPSGSARSADSAEWQESVKRFYARIRTGFRHGVRDRWVDYAQLRITKRLKDIIPPGSRVLDIGCGGGELLASLEPARGVGIDFHEPTIHEASRRHPHLRFHALPAESAGVLGEQFDFVILSQVLDEMYDLRVCFRALQSVCHARTRILVVCHSRLWQPILRLMEWCGLRTPTPERNWLPHDEIIHLLSLSEFETIRMFSMTIAPLYVPVVSAILNKYIANIPGFRWLGLNDVIIARSTRPAVLAAQRPRSVSIVVPARNEAGHIQPLLDRLPLLASEQEVIFVEGHSTDDTWNAILQAAKNYDGPMTIRTLRQSGRGKGDAVRTGFEQATGDILMILDADISVPPEELEAFCNALVQGQGELINGSRMVYLMDKKAMRFLNLLGNKFFGWMFTYLLSQRFRDTLCGTKALLRRDYERIAARRAFFGDFDPFGDFDLLFGAAKANLKILDIPVHYKARVYGETNISRFQHGWLLLKMCLLAARKIKFV